MAQVRTIKRYANRKLYDTQQSMYVTLDEIAAYIRGGEEVRIVDNKTKEDLTAVTLTQIIFEQEKKQKRSLPLATLRTIIQSGGEFFQRRISEPVSNLAEGAERTIGAWREEAERTVGVWREEAERTVGRLVNLDPVEDTRAILREFIENTQRFFENVQHDIDERIRMTLNSMPHLGALKAEIDALKEKVSLLETALHLRSSHKDTH